MLDFLFYLRERFIPRNDGEFCIEIADLLLFPESKSLISICVFSTELV